MAANRAATARTATREPEPKRESTLDKITDSRSRALLRAWMSRYTALADKIDALKEDQSKLKDEQIEPLRVKLGLAKIEAPDWFITRNAGRSSLDKEKLKRYLFEKGVSMELILEAVRVASKEGDPFTEIRRRKQNENVKDDSK